MAPDASRPSGSAEEIDSLSCFEYDRAKARREVVTKSHLSDTGIASGLLYGSGWNSTDTSHQPTPTATARITNVMMISMPTAIADRSVAAPLRTPSETCICHLQQQ